jgi:16S rRNA (cytosine1402-N4)-methyltransferase
MRHTPVLLNETIKLLRLSPNNNVVDCTLGDGGHAKEILKEISPNGKMLGIDADLESINRAKEYLSEHAERIIFVRDNFKNLEIIIKNNFNFKINGILMDLGWSTPQFEMRGRGFSFNHDEPLDMRYGGTNQSKTAKEIINTLNQAELAKIFRSYGEEKYYKEIAKAIIEERRKEAITSSKKLSDIIVNIYKIKLGSRLETPRIGKIHPATKVFQALRIAVNDELEVLKQALPQALKAICAGGRLSVITFHSLEDRIVKQFFKSNSDKLIIITKKPVIPTMVEIKNNPKARSAKLRVIEKI